ncbi:hypothetical protein Golob_008891 [Gossypium lobatum]|uniref:DUF7722 domain-containing protein n=1 Tax=Gossypium lobatum TaxID=34289 RepID=A0A7J8MGT5_9ROSI|nr:hypothetical protein [Gossypium lobatum]
MVNSLIAYKNGLTWTSFQHASFNKHTGCPKVNKKKKMSGTNCSKAFDMAARVMANGNHHQAKSNDKCCYFQMPLHYPRYKKSDYENMPEWQLDGLLNQYGLPIIGDANQKRKFAMGAFLWPSQVE